MDYKDLTPEQIEKAKTCKSGEELAALAKTLGMELTDDDLDKVAGGSWDEVKEAKNPKPAKCKNCGSYDTVLQTSHPLVGDLGFWVCKSCGGDFYAEIKE